MFFQIANYYFLKFFFILTPLTFKPHNFFIHFKQFKMLHNHHLKFYKSFLNFNSNKTTYEHLFEVWESAFITFNAFCFLSSWPPLLWAGCNFLNSFPLLRIFNVPNARIWGLQVLFGHQKQLSPPLGSGLPWTLKCLITDQFTLLNLRWLKIQNWKIERPMGRSRSDVRCELRAFVVLTLVSLMPN